MSERQVLSIKCEQDALNILEKYYENPPENAILNLIIFEDFEYYICGNKYNGVLNTDMMTVLIALQKSLYRIYAYFEYGTPDIRKLTKRDKERVEIVCTVEKGSAAIKALILQATNNIIQRMESKHLCILGCVLVISYFGTKPIIHYINSNKESKIAEINSQNQANLVQIIDTLAQKFPEVNYIKNESEDLRDKVIKNSTQFQDGIKYNRHYIPQEAIVEKAKQTREKATPVRLDGKYKITGIDYEEEYTRFSLEAIEVNDIENGSKFYAYLYNDMLKNDTGINNITFKPFYENKIFNISVNGNMLKDIITGATIYKINYEVK